MKISETLKTKKAEESFGTALIVIIVFLLPLWGATAMVIGSAIGLVAYVSLFRERLRDRGWLGPALSFTLATLAAVAVILVVSLSRAH